MFVQIQALCELFNGLYHISLAAFIQIIACVRLVFYTCLADFSLLPLRGDLQSKPWQQQRQPKYFMAIKYALDLRMISTFEGSYMSDARLRDIVVRLHTQPNCMGPRT